MKKLLMIIGVLSILTACTRVETGEVGVVRHFSGEVESTVLDAGLHMSVLDKIYPTSVREIPVQLADLKPTTKNNSSILSDLDVNIQYSISPSTASALFIKYRNAAYVVDGKVLPAFYIVQMQAKSVVADAVAQFEANEIGAKRNELEALIMKNLQADLNKSDPNSFNVTRVTISNLVPDERIRDSLAKIAQSENQKTTAQNELEIAKINAETNRVLSSATTPEILALKQQEALIAIAEKGNLVVVPMDFKGMMQLPSK